MEDYQKNQNAKNDPSLSRCNPSAVDLYLYRRRRPLSHSSSLSHSLAVVLSAVVLSLTRQIELQIEAFSKSNPKSNSKSKLSPASTLTNGTLSFPLTSIQVCGIWFRFSILRIFDHLTIMYPGGYTAAITNLSPRATESDVHNFFGYCGVIERVDVIRSSDYESIAYVTFKDAYALDTALLLNVRLLTSLFDFMDQLNT
ncbi:uncharacterized protein LOC123922266 [Trifolium pratense]|uniref:uncharacterized protein LOC123922266 n=1 Tax=Trifolium pratense TaxID=57577 RepID=UPI001E696708|nr:uncharacterized protein LOC123922266 [Trifolium pratense]